MNSILNKLKEELNKEKAKNEQIQNECENYKKINTEILEENEKKQEKINVYENNNYKDENEILLKKNNSLTQIIEEKNQEIEELKETINNMKQKNESPFLGLNKKDSSFKTDRMSMGGDKISDAEKVEKLIERIKEYKNEKDLNENLIKLLKEDLKNLNQKLKEFETFGGRISDYNEFIRLFNIILKDYKPSKKQQKEALSQLRAHLKKEVD